MKNQKLFVISTFLILSVFAKADPATNATPAGQFEVIDISGPVNGDPNASAEAARESWNKACSEWKTETMGLNKNNEILGISCNTPSCNSFDVARTQCTSTGTYKVKTAGVLVNNKTIAPPLPEPPAPAPLPPQHEIATAPPQVIIEAVPPPRVGFIWIPGFWGWEGRRHVWIPGRWSNDRPGFIWVGNTWVHQGRGWHFEPGRWEHRH